MATPHRLSRRDFLQAGGAAGLTIALAGALGPLLANEPETGESVSPPPNILFLMTDQMQAGVLNPGHPCRLPNLERLAARGVRFTRAYTPNPVCSPARASLMTGVLPHKHGIETVTGDVAAGKCFLRKEHPHWAQRLREAGYRTGYFGKWHVEPSETAGDYGWETDSNYRRPHMAEPLQASRNRVKNGKLSPSKRIETAGYGSTLLYGVTDVPAQERSMGIITTEALGFLADASKQPKPWCCFVSISEPHDAYITERKYFERYDLAALELPPSLRDDFAGRPGVYRKMSRVWQGMTEQEHREARACYFASIDEIDAQYGRILDWLDRSGQAENTIVVFTADHGDLLGAHGMYLKGYTAAEELYNIPMIVAGPGIARGQVTAARAGLHDLGPTLLEAAGGRPLGAPDSTSILPLLRDPVRHAGDYDTGYAEYHGSRIPMLQRIAWQGNLKYVLNGFDYDELYDLQNDPCEMHNLIDSPAHQEVANALLGLIWKRAVATGDPLVQAKYPSWRIASFGPGKNAGAGNGGEP